MSWPVDSGQVVLIHVFAHDKIRKEIKFIH